MSSLEDLPNELTLNILRHNTIDELINARTVNYKMKVLADDVILKRHEMLFGPTAKSFQLKIKDLYTAEILDKLSEYSNPSEGQLYIFSYGKLAIYNHMEADDAGFYYTEIPLIPTERKIRRISDLKRALLHTGKDKDTVDIMIYAMLGKLIRANAFTKADLDQYWDHIIPQAILDAAVVQHRNMGKDELRIPSSPGHLVTDDGTSLYATTKYLLNLIGNKDGLLASQYFLAGQLRLFGPEQYPGERLERWKNRVRYYINLMDTPISNNVLSVQDIDFLQRSFRQ
jgi:hypothetical protein